MNDVHDVQYLRNLLQNSQFITDINGVENFSYIFRKTFAEEISKNQREIILIIVSLFSSS